MGTKPQVGKATTIPCGPFRGIYSTVNPFDDAPDKLTDGLNGYLPDCVNGGEFAARPGVNMDASVVSGGAPLAVCSVSVVGAQYTFAIIAHGGSTKIYRATGIFGASWVDVTPAGVSMTAVTAGNVHMMQFGNALIVTDGTVRPWVGTNLSSTPITGTFIDIDGAAGAWTCVSAPTIYVDSLMLICATVPGGSAVQPGIGFVYSEPNQPLVGYTQANFANFYNLIQTGSTPIYVLKGTNTGMFYSRESSWGMLTGAPGINFQNSATHDVVSYNVGCVASKTVQLFGNYLYFLDSIGRPWRFAIGGAPEPLWLQLRQYYEAQGQGALQPTSITNTAWAAIEPNLNVYVAFTWSGPTTAYVFDANTGTYFGRWQFANWGTATGPVTMQCGAVFVDSNLNSWLMMLGDGDATAGTTCVPWTLWNVANNIWVDGVGASATPVLAQSPRLGYGASAQLSLNTVRAVTSSVVPVALSTVATNGTVVQGTVTPPASSDGTNLAQWKPVGTQGRGFLLQFTPQSAASFGRPQFKLFHAEIDITAADVQMSDL